MLSKKAEIIAVSLLFLCSLTLLISHFLMGFKWVYLLAFVVPCGFMLYRTITSKY